MAGSRKSPKNNGDLLARISGVLRQHLRRGDRIIVALSGGVDSVVLCDLLRRWCKRRRCELRTLHVNHRISPNAAHWAHFCRALCREWKIPLKVVTVSVKRGGSLEAAAREARYRVFAQQNADIVALAHHLDDQAETLLLQLLRGAGVRGLSAMPEIRSQGPGTRSQKSGAGKRISRQKGLPNPESRIPNPAILRPLLDISREEIEAYAWRRKLDWVEDESNSDLYFDRNFLRHEVLPRLARRYPAYRSTLARAGRNLAESAQLLDELAEIDLADMESGGGVPIALLRKLGPARAKNVLRHYLRQSDVTAPNAARLEECVRQALSVRHDARIAVDLDGHALRYFSGRLFVVAEYRKPPADYRKSWRGETQLRLDELGGTLTMRRKRGEGISLAKLDGKALTVRVRRGGETLRPDAGRPRRSLKNLLQEARVPPWRRATLPLLYCGRTLVGVPGIGIDAAFKAERGQTGLVPDWKSD